MGVGPHDGHLLRLFGAHVKQGFGHAPYQVGSSLAKKAGWRDVDVRLMLPDEEYLAYFGSPYGPPGADAGKRSMWELAWTTLGRKMTGLPIDFQIQDTTIANDEFPGPRSALQIRTCDLAVVPPLPRGWGIPDSFPKVAGFCPMGCGETLFLGESGHVTCSFVDCPSPCAADTVLHERETEHVVVFTADDFTIQHPLRDRIAGELFDCPLHDYLWSLAGPLVKPGRYRATTNSMGGWSFSDLPDPLPSKETRA